jgi:hypothetical protein
MMIDQNENKIVGIMSNCTAERGMNVKSSLAFNRAFVIFRFSTQTHTHSAWDLSAFAFIPKQRLLAIYPAPFEGRNMPSRAQKQQEEEGKRRKINTI